MVLVFVLVVVTFFITIYIHTNVWVICLSFVALKLSLQIYVPYIGTLSIVIQSVY